MVYGVVVTERVNVEHCRTQRHGGGPQAASRGVWSQRDSAQAAQELPSSRLGSASRRDAHRAAYCSRPVTRTVVLQGSRRRLRYACHSRRRFLSRPFCCNNSDFAEFGRKYPDTPTRPKISRSREKNASCGNTGNDCGGNCEF